MKEAFLVVLKLLPTIGFLGFGLRFLFDTEDFNIRRKYKKYFGRGDWRLATKLLGVLLLTIGSLLAYLLVWPEVDAIIHPDFVPGERSVRQPEG
ncbi:MAG: hypothetical protein ACFCU4_01790 [Puniceicoccaceae bacterium]